MPESSTTSEPRVPEQSPTTIESGRPLLPKPTRRQGTGLSQLGLASASSSNTSTTTVPASTGLWARVCTIVVDVVTVADSSLTVCDE